MATGLIRGILFGAARQRTHPDLLDPPNVANLFLSKGKTNEQTSARNKTACTPVTSAPLTVSPPSQRPPAHPDSRHRRKYETLRLFLSGELEQLPSLARLEIPSV